MKDGVVDEAMSRAKTICTLWLPLIIIIRTTTNTYYTVYARQQYKKKKKKKKKRNKEEPLEMHDGNVSN